MRTSSNPNRISWRLPTVLLLLLLQSQLDRSFATSGEPAAVDSQSWLGKHDHVAAFPLEDTTPLSIQDPSGYVAKGQQRFLQTDGMNTTSNTTSTTGSNCTGLVLNTTACASMAQQYYKDPVNCTCAAIEVNLVCSIELRCEYYPNATQTCGSSTNGTTCAHISTQALLSIPLETSDINSETVYTGGTCLQQIQTSTSAVVPSSSSSNNASNANASSTSFGFYQFPSSTLLCVQMTYCAEQNFTKPCSCQALLGQTLAQNPCTCALCDAGNGTTGVTMDCSNQVPSAVMPICTPMDSNLFGFTTNTTDNTYYLSFPYSFIRPPITPFLPYIAVQSTPTLAPGTTRSPNSAPVNSPASSPTTNNMPPTPSSAQGGGNNNNGNGSNNNNNGSNDNNNNNNGNNNSNEGNNNSNSGGSTTNGSPTSPASAPTKAPASGNSNSAATDTTLRAVLVGTTLLSLFFVQI